MKNHNYPNRYFSNSIFQKSSLVLIIKIAGLAAGFIFTFLISRFYGAESLGILSICMNMVQVGVLFSVAGFDSLILRSAAQWSGTNHLNQLGPFYKSIIFVAIFLSLLISAILFTGSEFLAGAVFSKPVLKPYIMISSVMIIPATLLLIHASGLRGLNQTGWFSFFRETSRFLIAVPIAVIAILFFSSHAYGPLFSYTIAVIIAGVWCSVLWISELRKVPALIPVEKGPAVLPLLKLSIPFFIITFLAQLSPLLNPLILGIIGTTVDVGVFNVAIKIAGILSLPLMAVNMATATSFASLSDNKKEDLKKTISASTKLIFWTSLPLLLLCLFAPGVMMNLFGNNFDEGATALVMLAIAQFINAITGSVGVIMQMTGHEKTWGIILFCSTIINIILMTLLVPVYGLNGAAFSLMVTIIMNNIAGAVYLKLKMNITTYYIPFFTP